MEQLLSLLKKILPQPLADFLRAFYHPLLSFGFAFLSGFPAKKMVVVGVNGTKGKSTVSEMLFAIFNAAGHKTALASTIRFTVGDESKPNLFKMTMPGRGFLQRFLKEAKQKNATHAVVELTTEGAREWRHKFLYVDGLIMLNVQKEHIERFGSFENYVKAKWTIAKEIETSSKQNRAIVVCTDDEENAKFKNAKVPNVITYSKNDLENLKTDERETSFTYKNIAFTIPLPGAFSASNALSAIKLAEHFGIPLKTSRDALKNMQQVKGRLEPVDAGQNFNVIVDYAHTPDSLRALYSAFPGKKICVLGNTGGGRDMWKRPLMGQIADEMCETVILTNEDPYDEDPEKIVNEMTSEMKRKPLIIMDRREAIRKAISLAQPGDSVLVSGKGTDPYIMEASNKKTPWSDYEVTKEELEKLI